MASWSSDPAASGHGPAAASQPLDADSFAALWVAELFAILPGPEVAVLLLRGEDGVLKLRGAQPARGAVSETVKSAAARIAEKGRPVLSAMPGGAYVVGAAVQRDGVAAVALAEVRGLDAEAAQRAFATLKAALGQVEAWLLRSDGASGADAAGQGAEALALMARALEGRSFRDAAGRAATELAQSLGADRVSVARAVRRGARVEGLSHSADVKRRSDAADLLAAAADEALDQGTALAWPDDGPQSPAITRAALAALARHSGAGSVAVAPMGDPDAPWGALVAEFTHPQDAARALAPLDIAGAALAPLLDIKRREDRWLPRRAWDALVAGLGFLVGPASLGWKLLALALVAGAVFLATFQSTLRVTADAALVSENRVLISAPFDGFLSDRLVRAGDRVAEGAVLLTLDERALTLEKLRFEATRRQKEIERDAAISERDRTRLAVLSAEIAETSARLALTEAQLEAGRLRAPFDGVVATDLTTGRIGAPVGRGEELMQVAPLSDITLRLFVPDAEIDRVAEGQAGRVRLAAFPNTPLAFEITRLSPVTEPRDGANAFVASATLTDPDLPEITLGMEGIAKIDIARDLWAKGWAVPLYERLRLMLWSLWP